MGFKNIFKNPLFYIFILALFIRLFKLGELPFGFHVDEAKVAWNALSILKTGYDDHNNHLTLYYDSFGDYRPTGILYFTAPLIALFGRSEFATRFSVALFSALSIFPIYLITNLFNIKKKNEKRSKFNVGYVAAFLLSVSPWAIDLGRATNEVVISTFFALFAIYFFVSLIQSGKHYFGILTLISIILSYFLYHAIRYLGLPIFIIITYFYFDEIKKRVKINNWVFACLGFITIITIYLSTTKEGLARFNQVSIFKDVDTVYQINRLAKEDAGRPKLVRIIDSKPVVFSKKLVNEYSQYFSGDFLIGDAARPYRFATPGVGLLTYAEFILLIIGLIGIIRGNKSIIPLILLLAAPFPSSVTTEDAPNLSRTFLMLPFIIIIEAYGFELFLNYKHKIKNKLLVGFLILFLTNSIYFMHMYLGHSMSHRPLLKDFAGDSPTYRNTGTKELALKLDGLKTQYDKIVITNFPDSPYPWYAFFTGKDPRDFNKTYSTKTNERVYGNIIFSENKCPSDNALVKYRKEKILMVDSWECAFKNKIADGYPLKIVGTIDRPDGTNVYTLLERDFTKPLIIDGVVY